MAKYYNFPIERYSQGIKRIDEDDWFQYHQALLLQMANTDKGRELLCIDKDFGEITEIRKNKICTQTPLNKDHRGVTKSEFRVGMKWANIVRYRWWEFKPMAKSFYGQSYTAYFNGELVTARATDTFFPDPNPETSSVDGIVFRNGVSETLATIIAGAGTAANDTDNDPFVYQISSDDINTDEYDALARGIILFDTSSLSGTIDSSDLDLYFPAGPTADQLGGTGACGITTASPASNTALVSGDYAVANFGSTRLASDLDVGSVPSGAYHTFTLNASGIAAIDDTGVTGFGNRLNFDIDGTGPTWGPNENVLVRINNADQTGTSQDPKLTVVTLATFTPFMITF